MDRLLIEQAENALWRQAISGLRSARRWQFWIKVVLILAGAALGAIGGGMEGPLRPTTSNGFITLKGLLVIGGGGMAFVGGILLLLVDEGGPTLMAEARELARHARSHIDEWEEMVTRVTGAEGAAELLDRKRRERLSAIEQMLEVVEAALLNDADVAMTAEKMLFHAIHSIHKAVEYEGGDFFTISIFNVRIEVMAIVCIALPLNGAIPCALVKMGEAGRKASATRV